MEKFDRTFEMDTTKDYANGVKGEYIRYFDRKEEETGIEIDTNDITNPLVKNYWDLNKIEKDRVYDCNTKEEFMNLKKEIQEKREFLKNYE